MDADEPARAMFRAVTLTALVDGRPDLSEARVVSELVDLHPRFAAFDDAFELGVQARVLLDEKGVEDALNEIVAGIASPADRRLAFQLCARVMIADGQTAGEEAMVLGTLQELFALSPDDVRAILGEERARKGKPPSQGP
jgi:hypothetical protein